MVHLGSESLLQIESPEIVLIEYFKLRVALPLRPFCIPRLGDEQSSKYLIQVPLDVALRLLFLDREDTIDFGESRIESSFKLRFEFFRSVSTESVF